MDFLVGLPRTSQGDDPIWVMVDQLTKSAHILPVHGNDLTYKLSYIYTDEIVRLDGLSLSIVSDRDPKFTSRFWQSFQATRGIEIRLSTIYHPQTDGKSERTI